MSKVKFTSKFFLDLFYEVMNEFWLDNDTYVVVFQDMKDVDGDVFHIEAEYHKDEGGKITFTRVYEHENVDAANFVSHVFKTQIEEHILRKVGVLRENSMLTSQNIGITLKLDVPKDMSVGELHDWLTNLSIKVESPNADKVRVLEITNRGRLT